MRLGKVNKKFSQYYLCDNGKFVIAREIGQNESLLERNGEAPSVFQLRIIVLPS
jgi:hypothetical protein